MSKPLSETLRGINMPGMADRAAVTETALAEARENATDMRDNLNAVTRDLWEANAALADAEHIIGMCESCKKKWQIACMTEFVLNGPSEAKEKNDG